MCSVYYDVQNRSCKLNLVLDREAKIHLLCKEETIVAVCWVQTLLDL